MRRVTTSEPPNWLSTPPLRKFRREKSQKQRRVYKGRVTEPQKLIIIQNLITRESSARFLLGFVRDGPSSITLFNSKHLKYILSHRHFSKRDIILLRILIHTILCVF